MRQSLIDFRALAHTLKASLRRYEAIFLVPFLVSSIITIHIGPSHAKMCLMPYANNKGADQPAHPRSLISTVVVCCLDSMICILALPKVSRF